MSRAYPLSLALLVALAGILTVALSSGPRDRSAGSAAALALDLSRTRPLGPGGRFRPPALSWSGSPVSGLRCLAAAETTYGTHIELFAANHEVLVPPGIGIAAARRQGPFVTAGRCRYPLSTVDPTGVVRVRRDTPRTPSLGQLFALWGQPLSQSRLTAFTGTVRAYLGGRKWSRDPRLIRLTRHAQIVLEVGPFVAPHPFYLFPGGL